MKNNALKRACRIIQWSYQLKVFAIFKSDFELNIFGFCRQSNII